MKCLIDGGKLNRKNLWEELMSIPDLAELNVASIARGLDGRSSSDVQF